MFMVNVGEYTSPMDIHGSYGSRDPVIKQPTIQMDRFSAVNFSSEAANARLMLETFGPTVFFNATKLLVEGKPRGFVGSSENGGLIWANQKEMGEKVPESYYYIFACNV